ncbi:MAG: hypothetical protein U9O18_02120 [Chloroflexota bacterium]|nr:hypothetical protein [Chloroflexota bacterium]
MTDQTDVQPESGTETTLHQPAAEGGLEAAPLKTGDYRDQLQSRRWNAAPLENPEVEKTDPHLAVLAFLALGAITLIVLVIGYGIIDLWGLPA